MEPIKEINPNEKISERSTKKEIWDAYNQLAVEIKGAPIEAEQKDSLIPDAVKNLANLKLRIGEDLDKIGSELVKDIDNLQEARTVLNREKQRMIVNLEEQKRALEDEIEKVKIQWENEKRKRQLEFEEELRQKSTSRRREEEEYAYGLSKKQREENDEYEYQKKEREKLLEEREKAIKSREEEIANMEKELTAMPEKINQAVKEARENLAKELIVRHNTAVHEIEVARQNETSIAEMKIANAEATIKTQTMEIENLKRQLGEASRQLKEIAVSVIENRSPKPVPTPIEIAK